MSAQLPDFQNNAVSRNSYSQVTSSKVEIQKNQNPFAIDTKELSKAATPNKQAPFANKPQLNAPSMSILDFYAKIQASTNAFKSAVQDILVSDPTLLKGLYLFIGQLGGNLQYLNQYAEPIYQQHSKIFNPIETQNNSLNEIAKSIEQSSKVIEKKAKELNEAISSFQKGLLPEGIVKQKLQDYQMQVYGYNNAIYSYNRERSSYITSVNNYNKQLPNINNQLEGLKFPPINPITPPPSFNGTIITIPSMPPYPKEGLSTNIPTVPTVPTLVSSQNTSWYERFRAVIEPNLQMINFLVQNAQNWQEIYDNYTENLRESARKGNYILPDTVSYSQGTENSDVSPSLVGSDVPQLKGLDLPKSYPRFAIKEFLRDLNRPNVDQVTNDLESITDITLLTLSIYSASMAQTYLAEDESLQPNEAVSLSYAQLLLDLVNKGDIEKLVASTGGENGSPELVSLLKSYFLSVGLSVLNVGLNNNNISSSVLDSSGLHNADLTLKSNSPTSLANPITYYSFITSAKNLFPNLSETEIMDQIKANSPASVSLSYLLLEEKDPFIHSSFGKNQTLIAKGSVDSLLNRGFTLEQAQNLVNTALENTLNHSPLTIKNFRDEYIKNLALQLPIDQAVAVGIHATRTLKYGSNQLPLEPTQLQAALGNQFILNNIGLDSHTIASNILSKPVSDEILLRESIYQELTTKGISPQSALRVSQDISIYPPHFNPSSIESLSPNSRIQGLLSSYSTAIQNELRINSSEEKLLTFKKNQFLETIEMNIDGFAFAKALMDPGKNFVLAQTGMINQKSNYLSIHEGVQFRV
ncbi:hypothetical protein BN1013_01403 [Candidatus Rubidus massiliensis]|nr:MAG: hypothetical protein BGO10_04405 [Chlamydia sp. 32-24]CDZ80880.1 hypothetical protein BN1013_01403 [Candidatus Rubidus massiliensis]